jgi:hypothetical protein
VSREGREKQKEQDGQEKARISLHAVSIGCKPPFLILLPCTLHATRGVEFSEGDAGVFLCEESVDLMRGGMV